MNSEYSPQITRATQRSSVGPPPSDLSRLTVSRIHAHLGPQEHRPARLRGSKGQFPQGGTKDLPKVGWALVLAQVCASTPSFCCDRLGSQQLSAGNLALMALPRAVLPQIKCGA